MSTCPFKTLLPRPSAAEVAIEEEFSQKYCRANPDILRDIHDPWKCPPDLLPWLAYALSVDVWSDSWPEFTQRTVIANSLEIHRHKGTRGSIEDAFAALGITAEIKEWFEMEPKGERGTMSILLWVNDNIYPDKEYLIGAELVRDIKDQIDRTKRASIHYTYQLGLKTHTGFSVASTGQALIFQRVDAGRDSVTIKTSNPTGFSVASTAQAALFQRIDAGRDTLTINSTPSSFRVGCTAQLTPLIRLEVTV